MMNRLYNSLEPRVMDDDMLKLAVGEQGPQEEAGQLAKQEGILFKDVLSLQLDFQNILRIDNLWQFENLRKLQLDNNIIERIEGLENLTHLVWLDLSFNNIEAIEGLDTLVNLEDLSLFNNRISKIDSLDALVKLQVLSLGNNQISNMMNIIYLRRFKDLRALGLSGNPMAETEDYRMFIWAYLPDLVYLDSRRIDEHMKEQAEIKHQYSIDELKHRENLIRTRLEDEQSWQKKLEDHKSLSAIRDESELTNVEMKIVEYSEDITELYNGLMTLEMQLVEQLEETINMFERNIIDLVGFFIENVQSLMAQCRDLETHHHEKLLEISINTLEKIVKGELDEDLPEDVRALFVDKDTIVNAVGASHDIHLLKIDNREDELVTRINSWCTHLVDKIHKDEIIRNRKRVKEINQYIDHMQNELDNLDSSDIID
ncbi:dynein regulatory complex subunit 3 isoform X3 [Pteropus medius]|uniref:Dynein regulatory complex subunit 3 n=1 Tax=Pteropus vampyrus TaxID=132908 RepID=A0A6P6CEC7_PTEVA|nr:dynein regulatory complex subunit 3 isoform X2 [Pteropus vampyrus]XP_039703499.1 dynein regulatory complex subunit 3 isoform X3 [Pteropus giganteus]